MPPAKRRPSKPAVTRRTPERSAKRETPEAAAVYTKPRVRERLKKEILAGTKGGRTEQWSARKSQLLTHAYEEAGGGYKGKKTAKQKSLAKWTDEKWQTKSGTARARSGKTTSRYLPEKAWEKLTPAERKATDAKKRKASRGGEQFVANTKAAKSARRRTATAKSR